MCIHRLYAIAMVHNHMIPQAAVACGCMHLSVPKSLNRGHAGTFSVADIYAGMRRSVEPSFFAKVCCDLAVHRPDSILHGGPCWVTGHVGGHHLQGSKQLRVIRVNYWYLAVVCRFYNGA